MHIYIYIYTYMCVYIYIERERDRERERVERASKSEDLGARLQRALLALLESQAGRPVEIRYLKINKDDNEDDYDIAYV